MLLLFFFYISDTNNDALRGNQHERDRRPGLPLLSEGVHNRFSPGQER